MSHLNVARISEYLKIGENDLIDQFLDLDSNKRLILKSHADHDCIFLGEKGCRIYPVRPLQCREFPLNWNGKTEALDCPLVEKGILKVESEK